MNSGKVLLGIVGGAAAGALIGVLFAPDKGSNTRKKILDSSKDYVDDLKGKLEGLVQNATNRYDSYVSDATDHVTKEVKGIIAKELK